MRFDAQEYLDDWAQGRGFPRIHDAIFSVIREEAIGVRFCDLCGCTGLLGQRILDKIPGSSVVGIEADEDAVSRGRAAGIIYDRLVMKVGPETLDDVTSYLRRISVDVIVARRALPELFTGHAPDAWPVEFARALALNTGVREVFVQGRNASERSSPPYASVDDEIVPLLSSGLWKVRRMTGAVAYLTRV